MNSKLIDLKYEEYQHQIKELNKAKDMLRQNMKSISSEAKRDLVKFISGKQKSIEIIEKSFNQNHTIKD
jgi:hypothetical protein